MISAASLNETESGCWGSKGNLLRDVRLVVGFYTFILPVLPQSTQGAALEKMMLEEAISRLTQNWPIGAGGHPRVLVDAPWTVGTGVLVE